MSLRYFSQAFDARSNSSGEMPLSPPTSNTCRPPSALGSGMSMPSSRMQLANFSSAWRASSLESALPAADGASSPQAARLSADSASSAAATDRMVIGLLSQRVAVHGAGAA